MGAEALEHLRHLAQGERSIGRWRRIGGTVQYVKGSSLRGKSTWRHALRAGLGLGLPRLREFDNLQWLRGEGFDAPRPLAAWVTKRSGRPSWQGLITERCEGTSGALDALARAAPDRRQQLVRALGSDIGRLHRAGFVHRDLYLRNLLLATEASTPRTVFLDCWRGGPPSASHLGARLSGRGPAFDLGCLFVHLPSLVEPAEEELFLESYCAARRLADARRPGFLVAVRGARRFHAQREARRKRSDGPPIQEEWPPPTKGGPA